ncbi:hypothetical protein [Anderseniella sp. Alg231-50]|uniref:hypothetical protein n=1 Tax=Anderseniella sp. Alg231-50 TaxID=1922226 RepID=UPI00307BF583
MNRRLRHLFKNLRMTGFLGGMGAVVLFLLVVAPVGASAAECKQRQFYASEALSSIKSTSDARSVANTIGEMSLNTFRCEVEVLVNAALDQDHKTYFQQLSKGDVLQECGYTDPARMFNKLTVKRRLAALRVLYMLPREWSVPSFTGNAASSVYSLLKCLESQPVRLGSQRDRSWRELWNAIERAHAKAEELYRANVSVKQQQIPTCDDLTNRLQAINSYQKYTRSRFGAASFLVSAQMRVGIASNENCDFDDNWLDAAVKNLEESLNAGAYSKSLEGWRFVNDATYMLVLLNVLRGDQEKFKKYMSLFVQPVSLIDKDNEFSGNVHPVAKKLLDAVDAGRVKKSLKPYVDQVYVKFPVPGYSRKDSIRGHYSMVEFGDVLKEISNQSNWKCSGRCLQGILRLDALIRKNLVKKDVKVVAGSYIEESAALNGKRSICGTFRKGGRKCPFVVERFDQYHRVSTVEMNEPDARKSQEFLNSNGIQSFLSRPRLLPPL